MQINRNENESSNFAKKKGGINCVFTFKLPRTLTGYNL